MGTPILPGSATPVLAPTHPDPIVLASVGQQLLDRRCTVELANVGGCGELDVRLLVGRDGNAVSVEPLGPCDGACPADRWYAVRIDPEGTRCVWAGPTRPCPTEALVAFVEDLLAEDPQALGSRYVAVG